MKSITNETVITNGLEMSEAALALATEQVSSWLDYNSPNTKPKTPEELQTNAGNSLYATYDGHVIDHIAFKLLNEAEPLQVGHNKGSAIHLYVPHWSVGALVVKPGLEGFGMG